MNVYTYRPILEAPKDGTPIIAVCGGVEMAVAWDDSHRFQCWIYYDEDDDYTFQRAKPQPTEWRELI